MIGGRAGDALQLRLAFERFVEVDRPATRSSAPFVRASASGAPAATRSARARASAMRSSAGTTLATSPMRNASSAEIGSPTKRHLGGPRRSDESRQEPRRAAVRHEPDPPERQHEPRRRRRRSAGRRRTRATRPAPAATPLTRRDDWLAHGSQRPDDRVVALANLLVERRGVGSLALREVLARRRTLDPPRSGSTARTARSTAIRSSSRRRATLIRTSAH